MTIHLAKGLEFPNVFVVGMEENLFPSMMSIGSRSELEEERRLFYVALTRAKKSAYLTYSHIRYRWGKLIDCEPSRFLDELDDEHLEIHIPEYNTGKTISKKINPFDVPSRGSKFYSKSSKKQPEKQKKQPNTVRFIRPANLKPLEESTYSNGSAVMLNNTLTAGNRVLHERFGTGTITEINGELMDQKATIAFDNAGEKKLLLKFAKLQLIK